MKEATAKSWKSTFQKGHREFTPQTIRSKHLNDDEETEVEKENQVEGEFDEKNWMADYLL